MDNKNAVKKVFSVEELKKLQKIAFQKEVKISHSNITMAIETLASEELNKQYCNFSKNAKVVDLLKVNGAFKEFFNKLKTLCLKEIENDDNKQLLSSSKLELKDIKNVYGTLEDYKYKSSVKALDLAKLKEVKGKDFETANRLEAQIKVLKEEVNKSAKALKEYKESLILEARAKYAK